MELAIIQIVGLVYASSQSVLASNLSLPVPEPSVILGTVTDSIGCSVFGSFRTKSHIAPNRLLLVNIYVCKYGLKVAGQSSGPCTNGLCEFCADKSIIYSQSNPSSYFQCLNERFIPFSCPSDRVFVPATQKCEKGMTNKCSTNTFPLEQAKQPDTENLKKEVKTEIDDDRHLKIHLIQQFYTKLLSKGAWSLENDKASEQVFDEMYLNSSFHSVEYTSYNLSKSGFKISKSKNNILSQSPTTHIRLARSSHAQQSPVPIEASMQSKPEIKNNTNGSEEVANTNKSGINFVDKNRQFMLPLAVYLHSQGTKELYRENGYELTLPEKGLAIVMKNHALNSKAIGSLTLDDNSDIQRVSLSSKEFESQEVTNLIYLSHSQDNFEFQEESEQESIIKQVLNHKSSNENPKSVFLSLAYLGLPSESFAMHQMNLIRFAHSLKASNDSNDTIPASCVGEKAGESIEPLENPNSVQDSVMVHTPLKKSAKTLDEGVQTESEIGQNNGDIISNSEEINEPLNLKESNGYPGASNQNLGQPKTYDKPDNNYKSDASNKDKGRRSVETDMRIFKGSNSSEIPMPIIQNMLTQIDQKKKPFKVLKLVENGIIFNAIVLPPYNQTLMSDLSNVNLQAALPMDRESVSMDGSSGTLSASVDFNDKNVYVSQMNSSAFDKLETLLKERKDLEILKAFLELKLQENHATGTRPDNGFNTRNEMISSSTIKPTKSFSSVTRDRQEDYYSDLSSESNTGPKKNSKLKSHPITNTYDSSKSNVKDNALAKKGKDDVKQVETYMNNPVRIFAGSTQQRQDGSTSINNTGDSFYETETEPSVRYSGDMDADYVMHVLTQDPKITMRKDVNYKSTSAEQNESTNNASAPQRYEPSQFPIFLTKIEQENVTLDNSTRTSYTPDENGDEQISSTIAPTTTKSEPSNLLPNFSHTREQLHTSPPPPTHFNNQLIHPVTYPPDVIEQAVKGTSTNDYDYYYIQDSEKQFGKRATGKTGGNENFRKKEKTTFPGNRLHKDGEFDYVQYT